MENENKPSWVTYSRFALAPVLDKTTVVSSRDSDLNMTVIPLSVYNIMSQSFLDETQKDEIQETDPVADRRESLRVVSTGEGKLRKINKSGYVYINTFVNTFLPLNFLCSVETARRLIHRCLGTLVTGGWAILTKITSVHVHEVVHQFRTTTLSKRWAGQLSRTHGCF